ncbi:MAG: ATP-dependent Clp protease ATP-binding subunit [Clostridia bacterium]|nr:ATP-dependent Clp protease ATP-binding subunit [Clostridia bacterium]
MNENNYTNNLKIAIGNSGKIAKRYKLSYVGTEHILYGLVSCTEGAASTILREFGFDFNTITDELKRTTQVGTFTGKPEFTPNSKSVLMGAIKVSQQAFVNYVSTEHVLYSLIQSVDNRACAILRKYGVLIENLKQRVYSVVFANREQRKLTNVITCDNEVEKKNTQNEYITDYSLEKTPLEGFGIDLTQKAVENKLDPVIGRTEEIERVVRTLSRRTKNSPVLVGEPGVGKSAVVEGLAQAIVSGEVPENLIGKRIFSLNLSGLIAGAKYRGEFEERFKKAIDFLKSDSKTILFIDEIHNLVGAGATNDGMDAAEMIKPELARGELQVIGATTVDEYRKYIENDPALERRFQPITVNPPTKTQAKAILFGLRDKYEAHHKVQITDDAINSAVELSDRYITDRNLPDKAIDLIDEAAARAKISSMEYSSELRSLDEEIRALKSEYQYVKDKGDYLKQGIIENKISRLRAQMQVIENRRYDERAYNRLVINGDDVALIISEWTGIPLTKIGEEERAKLEKLEDYLHARVIGQEEAVNAVSRAIRRTRANLSDSKKPNGSFIFVGPTGVGKTELSKALAEAVYGSENAIVRIDMSEYMEKHDVAKLIGAAPGLVGYDEEGQLTGRVRKNPYSLILLDEIEKAHPDIFNLLLQVLDDGRLTDNKGRVVDFKNTIIIMTSNVGASECSKQSASLGFGSATLPTIDQEEITLNALKKHFKPEFLNRIDDIITFRKLTKDECGKILKLLLTDLKSRIENLGITLTVDESAELVLLNHGFDPEYGARPLKRVIQREVEDLLSEEIIGNRIVKGNKVRLYGKNDEIYYDKIY